MKKTIVMLMAVYGIISAYAASLFYIEPLAFTPPSHEKADLSEVIKKSRSDYTESDYDFIYEQTGLGRVAVTALDRTFRLADYQKSYFADIQYSCKMNSPVSFEERITDSSVLLAPLEDGDILVTNSSHVMSWRNGHAAIVTDAENGVTLEAVVIGKNSRTQDISKWTRYPNFAVLRLKGADKAERAAIACSAMEYLNDVPYRVTIGFFPVKYSRLDSVRGTQCAHLVWLAYAAHGYDIDSNHGLIVTPEDILKSDLFETVQTFGMG